MTKKELAAKKRRQAQLVAAGLCRVCGYSGTPNNGTSQLCEEHRRRNTLRIRERRRAKAGAFGRGYRCTLCLGTDHRYDTCELNPDAISA